MAASQLQVSEVRREEKPPITIHLSSAETTEQERPKSEPEQLEFFTEWQISGPPES